MTYDNLSFLLIALQWIGAATGASGALLLAVNNRWSPYGFVLFVLAGIAMVVYGHLTGADGIVFKEAVCLITSVIGIWRWIVTPRLQRAHQRRGDLPMFPVHRLAFERRDTPLDGGLSCAHGVQHGR